ncbi:MAG: type II secretion system protein [Alphaproteobacteria bacterium]
MIKSTFDTHNTQKGFTLIEMAVAILVLGLLIAPALTAYNLYEKNRKIERTDFSIDRVNNSIEGFFNAYGRYPCPAPRDAVSGDTDYGFESRDATTGDCIHSSSTTPQSGVIAEASDDTTGRLPVGDNLVVIGAIPFKTLNLEEDDMYDGYGSRLTYAVTDILTDPDDYDVRLGGISITKEEDGGGTVISAVEPPHTAHYIVLSHGEEFTGAFRGSGVRTGACASALSEEVDNCNDDSVFFVSERNTGFDDVVSFSGGKPSTPWQYKDGDTSDIHLKAGGENVVGGLIGNPAAMSLTTVSAFDVQNTGYDDQQAIQCGGNAVTAICLPHIDDITIVSGGMTAREICEANALNHPQCAAGYSAPSPSDLIVTVEREIDTSGNPLPDTGGVVAREICQRLDGSGVPENCFDPVIIGGADTGAEPLSFGALGVPFTDTRFSGGTPMTTTGTATGGNLKCPNDEMMVGIRRGQAVCASITEFDCPSGQVLSGITSSGELVCDNPPLPPCPSTSVMNSCGVTGTLPSIAAG